MLGFNSNATNWPLDFCKRNVLIFLFLVSLAVVVSWKDNDSRHARFLFFFFFLTLLFQIWKKKVIFCSLLPPPRCVLGFQLKKKKKSFGTHMQPRPWCTCFGRISINYGFRLRYWYWIGNRIGYIPPQFATLEKNNHIFRPCMIASKTIQDNGDRTYNVSFGLLSRNEENDKIEGFRDLK